MKYFERRVSCGETQFANAGRHLAPQAGYECRNVATCWRAPGTVYVLSGGTAWGGRSRNAMPEIGSAVSAELGSAVSPGLGSAVSPELGSAVSPELGSAVSPELGSAVSEVAARALQSLFVGGTRIADEVLRAETTISGGLSALTQRHGA